MKSRRSKDLKIRTIKSFTDVLILKYLKVHPCSNGYQILCHLHEQYSIIFSPGTVYHEIHILERNKLIESEDDEDGRIYRLTDGGEEELFNHANISDQIQMLVSTILSTA